MLSAFLGMSSVNSLRCFICLYISLFQMGSFTCVWHKLELCDCIDRKGKISRGFLKIDLWSRRWAGGSQNRSLKQKLVPHLTILPSVMMAHPAISWAWVFHLKMNLRDKITKIFVPSYKCNNERQPYGANFTCCWKCSDWVLCWPLGVGLMASFSGQECFIKWTASLHKQMKSLLKRASRFFMALRDGKDSKEY